VRTPGLVANPENGVPRYDTVARTRTSPSANGNGWRR